LRRVRLMDGVVSGIMIATYLVS